MIEFMMSAVLVPRLVAALMARMPDLLEEAREQLLARERAVTRELVELGGPPAQLDFAEFFTECAPRLHRWIARRCGSDRTVADDLVQEVFTRTWKHWARVSHYQNPHGWVFLVAKRLVKKYQRGLLKESAIIGLPELYADRPNGTDSLVDLTRALPHLSAEQRKVAFLVFLLEYTPAEAAQVLGLNGSTVRSHIRRARLQIARDHLLDPPGPDLPRDKEDDR